MEHLGVRIYTGESTDKLVHGEKYSVSLRAMPDGEKIAFVYKNKKNVGVLAYEKKDWDREQ